MLFSSIFISKCSLNGVSGGFSSGIFILSIFAHSLLLLVLEISDQQAFKNICTGCFWDFTTIFYANGSDYALLFSSYAPNQLDSSSSRDSLKKVSFKVPNSFIP